MNALHIEPRTTDAARAKSLTEDHGCRPEHRALVAGFCPSCEADIHGGVEHRDGCALPDEERASLLASKPAFAPYVPPKHRHRWVAHEYGTLCATCGEGKPDRTRKPMALGWSPRRAR